MVRASVDHPPAPWRMAGPFAVVPGLVDAARARDLIDGRARVVALGGRALGAILVADYRTGSTLEYGELAGLVAPVAAAGGVGGWVDSMWVDEPRSVAGGRDVWNVPKELASFVWTIGATTSVEVRDEVGDLLVCASWTTPRRTVPVPAVGHFLGGLDGAARRARMDGVLHVAPRRIALEVPAGSPLARLGLRRAALGVAGRCDLQARAPR